MTWFANLTTADKLEQATAALRRLAIIEVQGLGRTPDPWGHRCKVCAVKWSLGSTERHDPKCPLSKEAT